MIHNHDKTRKPRPRVQISPQDLEHLRRITGARSLPSLARSTGIPYRIVYNAVHGRVKSLSDRHYRVLFDKSPPPGQTRRVDGELFRKMVRLWLFLNHEVSESALYWEFHSPGHDKPGKTKKVDYRIFSGQVRTVDARLERIMLAKFASVGVDAALLNQWLKELETVPHQGMVPYGRVRPMLHFLQAALGVHPNAILKQSYIRYESGQLKRVSQVVYNRAASLRKQTEKVMREGAKGDLERLKESVSGAKPGYTLYVDIEEELRFLSTYAKKGAKHYLGRSTWTYDTARAKRIANRRVRCILADSDRLFLNRPDLPLSELPLRLRAGLLRGLRDVLVRRATQLFSQNEGVVLEKRILRPSRALTEYRNRFHGFTQFDLAFGVLGMKRKAFDLMVAKHCDIFRSVGTYAKRWYISDLYLKELSHNQYFDLISAKYDLLAKQLDDADTLNRCLN